jgi:hypothetical protein
MEKEMGVSDFRPRARGRRKTLDVLSLTGRLTLRDLFKQAWSEVQQSVLQQLQGTIEGLLVAEYKRYWNRERLHSGSGYRPPAEFAAQLASGSAQPLRPTPMRHQPQPTLISTGT